MLKQRDNEIIYKWFTEETILLDKSYKKGQKLDNGSQIRMLLWSSLLGFDKEDLYILDQLIKWSIWVIF